MKYSKDRYQMSRACSQKKIRSQRYYCLSHSFYFILFFFFSIRSRLDIANLFNSSLSTVLNPLFFLPGVTWDIKSLIIFKDIFLITLFFLSSPTNLTFVNNLLNIHEIHSLQIALFLCSPTVIMPSPGYFQIFFNENNRYNNPYHFLLKTTTINTFIFTQLVW